MKLKEGSPAPDFKLQNQNAELKNLSDYKGRWVLVYFYPKDDTPGCTAEACSLRDNFQIFKKQGVQILGVSVDSVKSHVKFSDKYKLPFEIFADEGKEAVKKFGVWGKKRFMGREYIGTIRSSFLVDPRGVIVKIYPNVKPKEHAQEILDDLKFLKQA